MVIVLVTNYTSVAKHLNAEFVLRATVKFAVAAMYVSG